MTKAYDYGANRVWILNVGDLKPGELGMENFLRLAWDPHAVGPENPDALVAASIARDFGPEHAAEITAILRDYYHFNFLCKPEFLEGTRKQSVYDLDSIELRLEHGHGLVERADALKVKLPAEMRAAYYQLVLYPVRCSVAMNDRWLNVDRYDRQVRQGRASAGCCLEEAQRGYDTIQRETAYYNDTLSGGKWRYMMSSQPRDQPVFAAPARPVSAAVPEAGRLCVADDYGLVLSADKKTGGRMVFSRSASERTRKIEVFNGGRNAISWTAAEDAPWIRLGQTSGEGDAAVKVSIDWTKVPGKDGKSEPSTRGTISFRQGGAGAASDAPLVVDVYARNRGNSGEADLPGIVFWQEDNSIVIHPPVTPPAEGKPAWKEIQGLGTSGRAYSVFPVTYTAPDDPERIRAEAPCLSCQFRTFWRGDWQVELRTLPTWPVAAGRRQRYAVAVDDQPLTICERPLYGGESNPVWQYDVVRNASETTSTHRIEQPGIHTVRIWAVDPGVVVDGILLSKIQY